MSGPASMVRPDATASFARQSMKWLVATLVCLTVVFRAGAAEASHFRYGTINWSVPDPIAAPRTVKFIVTTAWRSDFVDAVTLQYGDGATIAPGVAPTVGSGVDSVGATYVVTEFTATHTYPGNGPYVAFFTGSARIGTLVNGANGTFTVQTSVAVGGSPSNTAGPTSAAPPVIQLQLGAPRSYSFPMFDADGDPSTCRFASAAETGLPAGQEVPKVPAGGAVPTLASSGNNCIVSWDLSQALAGQSYVLHLVMESIHNAAVSSTAIDLIVQIVTPPPPVCTGSAVYNVSAGQIVSAPTSAAWTTVGNATVSMINAPALATLTPGGSGASPFSNTFTWTPTVADLGTTKTVIVNYVNAQNLSCASYITINTAACPVCTGLTPFCDPALRVCAACTADNGGAGVKACGSSNPYCTSSGACGRCGSNADCATGPHAGPYCALTSGACSATCTTDAQCGAGNWCNAGSCAAQLGNDVAIPVVAGHSPVLNGTCTAAAATAVCASGTCEPDGKCGLRNGTAVPGGQAASVVCRAGLGDIDGLCGLANGSGTCTAVNQASLCRSFLCATSGPNSGKCVVCTGDAQCSGGAPACSPSTNTCVQCTVSNASACGGSTPLCDATQSLCAACNGDSGSSGTLACPLSAPLCVSNGLSMGSCGLCATRSDCAGPSHAGPVCDATTGACGSACRADSDCDASEWCNASTCTAKLVNGSAIPNVPTHVPVLSGACSPTVATAVCASGACDVDNRCGLVNGTTVPSGGSGASVCRAGVADLDGKCGLANGSQSCTASNAATRCRSTRCAIDGANVGKCVECLVDATCSGATPACDGATNTCAVCTASNATACGGATPLCNTATRACVACNGDSGGTASFACPSDHPYCVSQGAAAGGCSKCTMRTDCSTGTHGGPVCDVTSGSCGNACSVDAQCASSEWCNAAVCVAKLANGAAIPVVSGHAPALNGVCTVDGAGAVCASQICDTGDNRCGLPNGANVPLGTQAAEVCRAAVADSDGKCGYANGSGSCSGSSGAVVCRSAICATTGANAGKCVSCVNDASCNGPTPACDVTSNSCATCTATNGAACTGRTPVCDMAQRRCTACASDASGASSAVLACGSSAPYCVAEGAQAGSCSKCTQRSDCTGEHNGAVCDVTTGACGTACAVDGDCDPITEYCTATGGVSGVCASKLPNGSPLPAMPADVAICTDTVGLRVCLSGVCDSNDGRCGRLTGNVCSVLAECRSSRCSELTNKCVVCETDSECTGGTYCDAAGTCSVKKTDGASCARAAECTTERCENGSCGVPSADGGVSDGGLPEAGGGMAGRSDAAPRRDVTIEGGGISCAVAAPGGRGPSHALWALAALAVAGARRRARRSDRPGRGAPAA